MTTTTTTRTPAQQIQHALRYFFEADRALDGARANLRRGVTLKDVDAIARYRDDAADSLRAAGKEIGDDAGDVPDFERWEGTSPLDEPSCTNDDASVPVGKSQLPSLWDVYAQKQFGQQGV